MKGGELRAPSVLSAIWQGRGLHEQSQSKAIGLLDHYRQAGLKTGDDIILKCHFKCH